MRRLPSLARSAGLAGAGDPSALAVVDGETRWTWRDLDERADSVAVGLRAGHVGTGDAVALLAVPTAAAIAALHGIARLGAVVAPLGMTLTAREQTVAAEVVRPRLVVHGPGLAAAARALDRPMLALEGLFAKRPGPASDPSPGPAPDLTAPALIVLTSGTAARPKAVVLSTEALVASAEAWLAALPEATGWLLALGLGHVAGQGVVWRSALSAVPLVVVPRSEPAGIVDALASDPMPSHISLVPTTLAQILDTVADGPPPPTLRAVLLGGGRIPAELVLRAIAAGWPVVPTYGLTEAGSGVTALPTSEAADHPESAGRALPGVRLAIAEPEPDGTGEILVLTPALYTEYLRDPTGTSAAITDGGWLRTGDLGRLDAEGRLTVLDRRTDRIVRGGENMSPAEIESVLLDHPAIADAGVVARRDPTWGHVPVAAIVLRDGTPDPADDALARHCRDRLSRFKVPVAFVRMESLPRTSAGKLQRFVLRARLDHDAPAGAAGPAAEPAREPRLERPGGVRLAYRNVGNGPMHLLLLHGTLSSVGQLGGLTSALAGTGAFTIHAVDRRGSGRSRLTDPQPLGIRIHVDDLVAVLDAEGCRSAAVLGVSFGGVVALEFAALVPDRALAVVAYEPPYGPVAAPDTQAAFAAVAMATERAHRSGGPGAAAEAFMRGVAGDRAWDGLPERTRAWLAAEGDGAYVDAALGGVDSSGLDRIRVPTTILTGDASEALYRPIAEALIARIPGSRHVHLPGMTHASPIVDPAPIAEAVTMALSSIRAIHADPFTSTTQEPRP